MENSMHILLIEDEEKTVRSLQKGLEENNWTVDVALDGVTGLEKALENQYNVLVSDILMPGLNGLELCRTLRKEGIRTPVLLLSALGETDDKVTGLDAGADDYLTKPFEFKEFIARINALVRRQGTGLANSKKLRFMDIEMDLESRTVKRAGTSINLTPREFALLEFMVRNPGKTLSKSEIAEKVWDIDFDTGTNVVEVYVNYLRNKIDKGFDQKFIHTHFGVGYVLRVDA
jgi:two-component system copper resistance phosphate regulon response regulator CusR